MTEDGETVGTCDVCGREGVPLKLAPHYQCRFVCVDAWACADAWDSDHRTYASVVHSS